MKLSKRLQTIANLVLPNDMVADIGCDHAYLSIYLAGKNLCQKIIATEVVEGPYNIALNNIKKHNLQNKIKIYLTDGLINVQDDLDTIIIAGMGASSIINILKNYKKINNINKMIIQSNNDWEIIRRYLNSQGFYIKKEIYTNENKKDYITLLVYKGKRKHKEKELIVGIYNKSNINFYLNQKNKIESILKKIPNKLDKNYQKNKKKLKILEDYIT